MGAEFADLELINNKSSSSVIPRDISCLVDCKKLFLVYLILSLSDVSTFDKSEGLKVSPVDNIW